MLSSGEVDENQQVDGDRVELAWFENRGSNTAFPAMRKQLSLNGVSMDSAGRLIAGTRFGLMGNRDLPRESFQTAVAQLYFMVKPTWSACVLVYILVRGILIDAIDQNIVLFLPLLAFSESKRASFLRNASGALVNAVCVVSVIFVITILFVVLHFRKGDYSARYIQAIVIVTYLGSFIWLGRAAAAVYRISIDGITIIFAAAQLCVVNFCCIWFRDQTQSRIQKCALLVQCLMLTWPFLEFGSFTFWSLLLVMGIYDLLAVLLPKGPLNRVMEHFKYGNGLLLPGLVFQDQYFMIGVGDIVVYAALIGRAALNGIVPALTTTLGITIGAHATVIWYRVSNRSAIPAVPIAAVMGAIAMLSTLHLVTKYAEVYHMILVGSRE